MPSFEIIEQFTVADSSIVEQFTVADTPTEDIEMSMRIHSLSMEADFRAELHYWRD
jgi:hypothetical protein